MKPRVLYEVDPHNRLILKRSGRHSGVKRFRQVIYGRFKIDTKNRLSYEVLKPSIANCPQKIKFSGTYSLDRRHRLIYTLDKWSNQYAGGRIRLKTSIIDARTNEIAFLVTSRLSKDKETVYIMKLRGAWQADKNNRLTFGVKKEDNKTDSLTLFNAWRIGRNNEILYSCNRNSDSIALKGSWAIKDKYRLGYILDRKIGSGFDFQASLGRIVPGGKETYIKFDVVIGISKRKKVRRRLIFSGKWKLRRGRNISLEISPDKRKTIVLKSAKDILDKRGIAYIESFFKNKERYVGGGLAIDW